MTTQAAVKKSPDVLVRAYQLRVDLHKYIRDRNGVKMADLFSHIPYVSRETIRKSVLGMRDYGTLRIEITSRIGTIYATGKKVKTDAESRNLLKTHKSLPNGAKRTAKDPQNVNDLMDNPTVICGAITTHYGSKRKRPVQESRGQGALYRPIHIQSVAGCL